MRVFQAALRKIGFTAAESEAMSYEEAMGHVEAYADLMDPTRKGSKKTYKVKR